MLKVLCKHLEVENEVFVLVRGENENYNNKRENNHYFYGTIPKKDVENGRLKRALNGLEMVIEDSIDLAIKSRCRHIQARKWKENNPNASNKEFVDYIISLMK